MYTLYICKLKRAAFAVCAAALLLILTGCRGTTLENYREVDSLQLVQTLGVDSAKDALRVTASTGAGTESLPAVVLSREGNSIITAMESLQNYSAKEELYFNNTRYALMGENGAREHLCEFLDYVERNNRLRMDVVPFIVRGGEAEELITLSGEKSYEVTETLSSIERDVKHSGSAYPYSCREVSRSLSEYGGALVCAVAGKKTEGSVFTECGELTAIPAGYAFIKNGKLGGFLGLDAAKGANLLTNRYGYGAIPLKLSDGTQVTVIPDRSDCKLTATFDSGGTLRQLQAKVTLSAGLTEMDRPLDMLDSKTSEMVNSALSQEILAWCSEALLCSVQEKCDFMGLGGRLLKQYPKEISSLQAEFMETVAGAELSILTECSVKHSFNLDRPLELNGEEADNGEQ